MRVTFHLRFHTRFGQSLSLVAPNELFGGGNLEGPLEMHFLDDQTWEAAMDIPDSGQTDKQLGYHYLLREPDGTLIHDLGNERSLNPTKGPCDELLVIDSWNHLGFFENAFLTEPFQEVLLNDRQTEFRAAAAPPETVTHLFTIKAPLLEKDETLCLLGSSGPLGNWSTNEPILLSRTRGNPTLSVELDLRHANFPLNYKYGVYNLQQKAFVRFEGGNDRMLADPVIAGRRTIVNDGFAVLPSDQWKGAGVSVPVFSLRSNQGFGVGEFIDLKKLVDWCAQTGLKLIQILPVNDTTATHTWTDSYPYAAISAFALHPLYLNLDETADAKSKAVLKEIEPERLRLNELDSVDYQAVMRSKLAALKKIYALQKDRTLRSKEYRQFFEGNRDWLVPYALFCYLRDQYGTADFTRWPAHRQYVNPVGAPVPGAISSHHPSEATLTPGALTSAHTAPPQPAEGIAFHYFLQFHLHRQLSAAARYAHQRGVILKGDIPIGVYRHGADTWQTPELYCMNQQAGAPPDAFARKGQNWGFPTYNWPRMKESGFAWWTRRFQQMSRYFDAFRIDHILGFFRIWSIPQHAIEGIMGHFVPALPVLAEEFRQKGIPFERARFVEPWITDAVLNDLFGARADWVKAECLQPGRSGHYTLKPRFATQARVESWFADLEPTDENRAVKEGLFDLISNVLLFEDEQTPGEAFHFRFAIEATPSFQALEPPIRSGVWDLYIDYYFRRQEEFWRREAMGKLPELKQATNMLICGEDLGLVPACVPVVMRDLGLLSLEIQRMPKTLGREFSRPQEAPYLSVVTPSTHDMSTIRGWWTEDRAVTQRFFNQELGHQGAAPEACEPWIAEEIVRRHLDCPAMWSIFQIQDLLGIDPVLRRPDPLAERVNVPANPRNYWRYRMHLTLETLLSSDDFNQRLRKLNALAGR